MNMITANNISHSYVVSGRKIKSLNQVSFNIEQGEFVAIIGKNGCGKSTLAKHINALLPLQEGDLTVAGYLASNKKSIVKLRKNCGMVFQNPDNQFVSSIVEEDIKFGLSNFNLPSDDKAVSNALALVNMQGFEKRNINTLSGGQKQRVALAGILAIKPKIIIFDEATTMLEPQGRREILDIIYNLHRDTDITFIMISQYVEEVTRADKVIVMDKGCVASYGSANEILTNKSLLESVGLKAPFTVNLYYDLKCKGLDLGEIPLNNERLVDLLCRLK
jgi:energy-coupling factor transport system ATP-binding protein